MEAEEHIKRKALTKAKYAEDRKRRQVENKLSDMILIDSYLLRNAYRMAKRVTKQEISVMTDRELAEEIQMVVLKEKDTGQNIILT